jgi:hypothetical protein
MATKVFLSWVSKGSYVKPTFALNLWGRLGHHPYRSAQRTELKAQNIFENMKKTLNFEQFKKIKVKSFEEFKESPRIKKFFDNDIEKIAQAYEDYCIFKFNDYKRTSEGGNPATMI